jgi:ribonuclease P protein component
MPRATLPAQARMHSPSQFAAALKGRRRARGAFFMISSVSPAPPAGVAAVAQLGLIVPKRHAPLAVTRNAVKRVVREAFRHRRHGLAPGFYLVRLHAKVPAMSLTALKQVMRTEVDAHFERILGS